MKTIYLLLLFISSMFLPACQHESTIEIGTSASKPLLGVNLIFTSGKPFKAYVHPTGTNAGRLPNKEEGDAGYDEEEGFNPLIGDIPNSILGVSDAIVTIADGFSEIKLEHQADGLYASENNQVVEAGKTYVLKVNSPTYGEIVATEKVPEPVELIGNSIWSISKDGKPRVQLRIKRLQGQDIYRVVGLYAPEGGKQVKYPIFVNADSTSKKSNKLMHILEYNKYTWDTKAEKIGRYFPTYSPTVLFKYHLDNQPFFDLFVDFLDESTGQPMGKAYGYKDFVLNQDEPLLKNSGRLTLHIHRITASYYNYYLDLQNYSVTAGEQLLDNMGKDKNSSISVEDLGIDPASGEPFDPNIQFTSNIQGGVGIFASSSAANSTTWTVQGLPQ